MNASCNHSLSQRGFSLIELALVVAIVGLLLGAVLTPLATQYEARQYREARSELKDVKAALLGFSVSNRGRMPCPDTDLPPDGLENPCAGAGTIGGLLPWLTLGVTPTDRWGRLYRYRVAREYTNQAQTGFLPAPDQLDLTDVNGGITVQSRNDSKDLVPYSTQAVAVVVSHGENGAGGRTLDNNLIPAPDVATNRDDEIENTDGNAIFRTRLRTDGGAGCDDPDAAQVFCEYDDLVIFLSAPEVLGRLVSAGILP